MELVQRDEPCRGREKNGNAQQTCSPGIKTEPPGDAVTNGPHGGQSSVLHCHKNQGMTENDEEWGKEKNDRLDVVAEEGNIFDRDIETPMNQLPDCLDIIGEVKAPILEIGPACVGRPSPNKEGNDGNDCDNKFGWVGSLLVSGYHFRLVAYRTSGLFGT